MKYGSWEIHESSTSMGDIKIPTQRSKNDVYREGIYGNFTSMHKIAISGVCLFPSSWSVVFTTGGVRSIAIPLERERVAERIKTRGFNVCAVNFPTDLTAYHHKLIRFVAKVVGQMQPEKLLFHIPYQEYLIYIHNLEALIGKKINGAEQILSNFVDKVKMFFRQEMMCAGFDRYEYISPMDMGVMTTEESYLFPYVHPEVFGATRASLFAIEDLVELKIAMLAEQLGGYNIPVHFCVLEVPHPYLTENKKSVGNRGDVVSITLS